MSNIEVVDILKQQACHCSNKFFTYMLLKAGLGNYVAAQLFFILTCSSFVSEYDNLHV